MAVSLSLSVDSPPDTTLGPSSLSPAVCVCVRERERKVILKARLG